MFSWYNAAMNVKEITLGLTEDEFQSLGQALESHLEQEISNLKNKKDVDLLLETEIKLLWEFAQLGYTMYIRKEDEPGELTRDVYEWIDNLLGVEN